MQAFDACQLGAALTVGRDHAGDGGHDGVNAKVLDEEGQILVLSTGLVPDVARLIVVESDAVARAKQLGEVPLQLNVLVCELSVLVHRFMRNEVLEGRVGGRGQVLDGLQDDHGLAIGEHGRNGERDDAGHEDGEDLGQLGVLGHASPGGHDIDLHVSGAHSLCTCAMRGGEGEPKRGRGVSGGERGRRMVNAPCVSEEQRSDAPRRRSNARRPISPMKETRLQWSHG